jgi:PhnB protein
MNSQAIPKIYDSLIPSLVVADGAKAIAFYQEVFGATEMMRMNYPDSSKIAHAELQIRGHVLMLGDENEQMGVLAPRGGTGTPSTSVMIYFEDVDNIFKKAIAKGAKPVMPPMDMFWGDRYAKFIDPFGHLWGVATHVREVSKEEMAQAMASWGKEKPKGGSS